MNFLFWALRNWRWLLPTSAAALLAAWLGLAKLELADLRFDIARQETEAQKTLTAALVRNSKYEAENADLAARLEAERAKAIEAIDAGRADFDNRLRVAISGARRACPVPAATAPASEPAPVAAGSDGGRGRLDTDGYHRLRSVALKLQADVKECWAWAAAVGR